MPLHIRSNDYEHVGMHFDSDDSSLNLFFTSKTFFRILFNPSPHVFRFKQGTQGIFIAQNPTVVKRYLKVIIKKSSKFYLKKLDLN